MKVVSIVGARPQFIKCAPVSRALRAVASEVLVHTGQHYDAAMSEVFFRDLELPPPAYHLGVGSGSHAYQTGEMLKRIEAVLLAERPDWVLVYGDTNSTLAGALAAAKLHLPVAHVEAGLRSFNRAMPEEINRVLTDHLACLLLCPTETAVANLAREGLTAGVHLVGDVMYDALWDHLEVAERRSTILEQLGLEPRAYLVATVHRAENTDQPARLKALLVALERLAQEGYPVVFPVHPRTRQQLAALDWRPGPRLHLLSPLPYLDMLRLEAAAAVILTDSGGVQKEAYWLQVPCVTLREETEWVETVHTGWNVLVGTDVARIVEAVRAARPGAAVPWPWPRGAASRAIAALLARGGEGERAVAEGEP
ncbi:MAG: UDP-N-acetyl glucosamine 2-epimerase [Candidatus Tectimicrobiota bacterium]|nr:MAG: UDP-N-acetyl glucosamine 2-epimerase [Candidatus Tectomicrobia bacterium]